MRSKSFLLVFLTSFFALVVSSSSAVEAITADLVVDRIYLAPGSTHPLIVEITNPADSGFVITRAQGSGNGSNAWRNSPAHFELRQNENCAPYSFCPVDSDAEILLQPGESDRYYYLVIHVSADAPVGAEIRISDIHVTLSNENSYRNYNDIHLEHNFVAVVSSDGLGSQAELAAISTLNLNRGSADINATLDLNYPSQIEAGKHFEVTGTITNNGPEPISSSFVMGSHRHLGNHVRSYRQISCPFKCNFNGRFPVDQSETIDLLFRQIYYENNLLFSGGLSIHGPHAIIRDRRGRVAYLYADDIEVTVTHDSGEPTLAPEFPLPERDSLLITTSIDQAQRQIVFDPNTGNSWIPLSETQGMSLEEVTEETRPGGRFSGFSVAGSDEVRFLMLNHIYASKLEYPDYALFSGGRDLHSVAGTFLDLMGTTLVPEDENGLTRYARGMVADAPELNNATVEMSIRQHNISSGIFGLTGSFNRSSYHRSQYSGMGTWLVSNRNLVAEGVYDIDETNVNAEDARYEYGQLFIASVDVEGYSYKVTLSVIDKVEVIVQLVSVLDEFNLAPSATFDTTSLILSIPRLGLFVFPDTYLYFSVELELISGTDPPLFRLIHAEDQY